MLKMTGINLELVTDIDVYQMVEKGLRGGISYIANRYSKPIINICVIMIKIMRVHI